MKFIVAISVIAKIGEKTKHNKYPSIYEWEKSCVIPVNNKWKSTTIICKMWINLKPIFLLKTIRHRKIHSLWSHLHEPLWQIELIQVVGIRIVITGVWPIDNKRCIRELSAVEKMWYFLTGYIVKYLSKLIKAYIYILRVYILLLWTYT